jgi:hypothetical protein
VGQCCCKTGGERVAAGQGGGEMKTGGRMRQCCGASLMTRVSGMPLAALMCP